MFAAVVLDPLAQIEDLLAGVASEDRSTWPAAARSERVLELAHLAERVRAELLRAVGDWDAAGAWADDGAASGASWLGHRAAWAVAPAPASCRRLGSCAPTTPLPARSPEAT